MKMSSRRCRCIIGKSFDLQKFNTMGRYVSNQTTVVLVTIPLPTKNMPNLCYFQADIYIYVNQSRIEDVLLTIFLEFVHECRI